VEEIKELLQIIQSHNKQAVLAGGCVRDKILGIEPNDYDIATNATPEEIESMFTKTIGIGKAFGIINVFYKGKEYEIATFRTDGKYLDGRHPSSISQATIKEDALRRDFTINGIFWDPIKNEFYDFVSGQEDLKNRLLRFIGSPQERIQEDNLRMLRAVRFAIKFDDFRIDENTFTAIKENAYKITNISSERIREELIKIFNYDNPDKALFLLKNSGLLKYILPEVENLFGVLQNSTYHPEGDCFTHTILCMEKLDIKNKYTRWAALLHDIAKPVCFSNENGKITAHGHDKEGELIAGKILKKLNFSNEFIRIVCGIVSDHMKIKEALKMKKSTLKKLMAKEYFMDLLEVSRADSLAGNGDIEWYSFIINTLKTYEPEIIKPKPLIGGKELIELGLKPGPIFSKILNEVMDLQLEEKINSSEEALDFVRRMVLK